MQNHSSRPSTEYGAGGNAGVLLSHTSAQVTAGGAQPKRIGALTVEDSDGGDGDEVVGDASVEKNTRTPLGTRLPKSDSIAQRKGNIGAAGMAPAVVRAGMVKKIR